MKQAKLIFITIFVALFFSCNQNHKIDEENSEEYINSLINQKEKAPPSPILIDSALFWTGEDDYQNKNYHINAFSLVDTTDFLFYKSWSDSILELLKGGNESIIFFFRDKEGTPEITIATWAGDERYEKHCFLLIKYGPDNNYEYFWNPFRK